MGTETFNKATPHPCMKYGMQKKGEQVRGKVGTEYQQVNGGTQGYPNTNGNESNSYDKASCTQKNKFATTADMNLDKHGFVSGPSGKSDFKKGSRKGFGSEKSGPDIRAGKPGAAYV